MKRLYKSRKNKVIDGVCGGIADYFGVDPVLVRIVFVIFFFFGGSGLIAYIVGMIIMPRKPLEPGQEGEIEKKTIEETDREEAGPAASSPGTGALIIGILLVIIGGFFIMRNFHFFDGIYWWFRSHFWEYCIPGIIIITGVALIVRGTEK